MWVVGTEAAASIQPPEVHHCSGCNPTEEVMQQAGVHRTVTSTLLVLLQAYPSRINPQPWKHAVRAAWALSIEHTYHTEMHLALVPCTSPALHALSPSTTAGPAESILMPTVA